MSKFNLKDISVGETRYFDAKETGHRDLDHLRRNLAVTVHAFLKNHKDRLITTMTVGDKLSVRRWK